MLLKNLYATGSFWILCGSLIWLENRYHYYWLSGLLFLLAIPILVSYLAWIDQPLLHHLKTPRQGFFWYFGIVLLTALIVVMLGLLGSYQLKLWLNA